MENLKNREIYNGEIFIATLKVFSGYTLLKLQISLNPFQYSKFILFAAPVCRFIYFPEDISGLRFTC